MWCLNVNSIRPDAWASKRANCEACLGPDLAMARLKENSERGRKVTRVAEKTGNSMKATVACMGWLGTEWQGSVGEISSELARRDRRS